MDNDLYKIFDNTKFNHKYYLKTFKGAGAFGAVFLADEFAGDTKIQEVAIKAIRKDKMSSENIAKELITAIQLKHPHLINCITSEEGRLQHSVFDYPCFGLVMEIANGTLETHLQTSNPLKTKILGASEVKQIVQAIASGLAYLHAQSITHRDLKPANVLRVGNDWKISDFGISRKMGSETGTLTTSLTGTPIYMPPEVYAAQKDQSAVKVSPAWDMWSLGVTIVQMLTGELPFDGLADILQMKIHIKGNLPEPFDAIAKNCLREDPKQRWTAKQVLEALTPKPVNKLEFVEIPSGKLIMEGGHEIRLNGFKMGKYAVTQAQYKAVMGENPSYFKGNLQCPVENVTWYQAVEFCQKLSQQTGQSIRLPSETEWEYACRAGTTTEYYFGNNENDLERYGWYNKNSGHVTHPVGQKQPNAWGLYDMHGNVWEWCADKWTDNVRELPKDGKPFLGGSSNDNSLRGGSWGIGAQKCRSADRYWDSVWYDGIGFRVVFSLV
jgi:eukaryotic-like serine/threonine-protein kinase